MKRTRSPLTLRCDARDRGRERSFSMSSLSSCSIGNDHDRSRKESGNSDKYKRYSKHENKYHNHGRKHIEGHHFENKNDRSRNKHKSRKEHEEVYLDFQPNNHVPDVEGSVDPSVCNFRTTSRVSDRSVEPRNTSDDRLDRLEKMVELLVQSKQNPSSSIPMVSTNSTDSFNPKNTSLTTSMWLNKLSEHCMDQDFDDKSCIRYMESKMDGIMKSWYKTLNCHDFTWPELKMLITRTFPDNIDFAATLHLLVERVKKPEESITQYYYGKMYLLEACKITGANAVSCLIAGLNDVYIQEEARANNYLTPESLFSLYLSKLNNYGVDMAEVRTQSQGELEFFDTEAIQFQHDSLSEVVTKKKCYTCGKFGHIAEHCRHAPMCYHCRLKGHIAARCPQRD